jgi:hypothetical protein
MSVVPTHSLEPAESPLERRIAITLEEAAEAIGLSTRAFRDHLFARCPKFYAGASPRIPIRLFVEFVEELAVSERATTRDSAQQLLARVAARGGEYR